MLNEVIAQKPKKVFKNLANSYQKRVEQSYGEHILRQVVLTQDFSFPSEDFTGQLNDVVARKTRETIQLHIELEGKELMPIEEIKIDQDETGKRTQRRKRMEQYAPLIFEECYVKHKGLSKVANGFELEQDKELSTKIDPTGGIGNDAEF